MRNTICAALTTITLALCTALAECVITLQDTRKVDCVVYAWEKQGGLSCDWDHVSGADKEPDR